MKDTYKNFSELKRTENSNRFRIYSNIFRKTFLIFAPHGGGIEQGTSEICLQIKSDLFSFYLFEGKGRSCKKLHITSTNFNEPTLLKIIKEHDYAISIHGMTDKYRGKIGADIFIGGLNIDLINITTQKLMNQNFSAVNNIKYPNSQLSGKGLLNITNKCKTKKGMQLEISENLRRKFFENINNNKGRKSVTDLFHQFCDVITQAISSFENNLKTNH